MIKNCPFCMELIDVDSIKCKHCGEFINQPTKKPKSKSVWYTILLISGIFIFYYIGENQSKQSNVDQNRLDNQIKKVNDFFDNEVYSNVSAEIVKFGYLYGQAIEGNGIIYNRSDNLPDFNFFSKN